MTSEAISSTLQSSTVSSSSVSEASLPTSLPASTGPPPDAEALVVQRTAADIEAPCAEIDASPIREGGEKVGNARTGIGAVYNTAPEKCKACKSLLDVIAKRTCKVISKIDGFTVYINQQIYLAASHLGDKLENQVLSFQEISDDIDNLLHLYTSTTKNHPSYVKAFLAIFKQLMLALSEISNALEKMASENVTDWVAVSESCEQKAKNATQDLVDVDFRTYVPPMEQFDVLRKIGDGRVSEVFEVMHTVSRHKFAFKVTPRSKYTLSNEEASLRLIAGERAVAAMACDPCVSLVICTFTTKPDMLISLIELREETFDLNNYLVTVGVIAEKYAPVLTVQIFLAVEYLHLKGFIHRDLQPSNVILDICGRVKLMDFDSVKICRGHFPRNKIQTSYFKLTPLEFHDRETIGEVAFQAPEIIRRRTYGRAVDWWAFGVLLYKATTGMLPFRADKPDELKKKITSEELKWPKIEVCKHSASPELKELVHDLLRKRPTQRLGTKLYADLRRHQYISDAAFELGAKGNALRAKIFAHECPFDLTNELAKKKPTSQGSLNPPPLNCESPRLVFSSLQDIKDLDESARIFCFSSSKFTKFFDRLRTDGKFDTSESFFLEKLTPEKDIDYAKRDEGETVIAATVAETQNQRKLQTKTMEVTIAYRRNVFFFKQMACKVEMAIGDGRISYPVVLDATDNRANADLTKAITGDIIHSIEDTKVVGKTQQEFNKFVKSKMRNKSGTLRAQILVHGTFRQLLTNPNAVYEMTQKAPKSEILLNATGRCYYFRTRVERVWCTAKDCFIQNHIVVKVDPATVIEAGKSLLFGDIVLKINGKDILSVEADKLYKQFNSKKNKVSILEISVLRRRDLIEE